MTAYLYRSRNVRFLVSQINLASKDAGKDDGETKPHHLNQEEDLLKALHDQGQNELQQSRG